MKRGDRHREILADVRMFNEFDLYSKVDSKKISAAAKNYYKKLITDIFPTPLRW
jgi:hypothetical protein